MRLSSRKTSRDGRLELSMTSMIDVVFLLLIFFMTTAAFVKTEKQLSSAIKVEESSAQQTPRDLEPAIVEVLRNASGKFVYRIGSRDMTSEAELSQVLKQFPNKEDGAFVRVTDDAPFAMSAAAIAACRTARFAGVSYVPLKK
ncbi:MAG: biopolymer transporter ExbD [bacterium]|nr:biopolymer transporter ExbD [bacterium]